MNTIDSKQILIALMLVLASCKIKKNINFETPSKTKAYYVVYTYKNCFDCFNKLNDYLYHKYSENNNPFKMNYIFYKSSFLNNYAMMSKLNKEPDIKIVDFKDTKVLSKIKHLLDEKNISPYIIIDSANAYRVIKYNQLFDKEGNVIDFQLNLN